jgi:type IV pilus assembly protein PilE
VRGFSLLELVAVLAIMVSLLLVALPAYRQQSTDARRALARLELHQVALRQEQHFMDFRRYADDLRQLGFPDNPYTVDTRGNRGLAGAAGAIYRIELAPLAGSFRVRAVPRGAQGADRSCGSLSLSGLGERVASGGADACW